MKLDYHDSKPSTVGIELELRLLDPNTYAVKNCAQEVFDNIDSSIKNHVHKELLKSMIEIVTPVCQTIDEAVNFVNETANKISQIGKQYNFLCAALPMHPFEIKEDNEIFEDPRYESFKQEFQIIIRNFLISGLHLHVGVDDQQKAVNAYNMVIKYIPIFLALSANSPYHYSQDTGLSSYRTKVFDKLPRAGVPQYFDTYEDYSEVYQQLFQTNTIKKAKDVWWDVRISPEFGTIELRVCDAFYNPKRLKFIGLLYQALVHYGKNQTVKREYHQINLQNKWNATRYGMDADFLEEGKRYTIRNRIKNLIKILSNQSIFDELGTQQQINDLMFIIDESSMCQTIRSKYQKNNDFKEAIQIGVI